MIITEKHIIKVGHKFFNECDDLCFRSKNLYNQGLYNVRQHYFETKKYLNNAENYKITCKQDSYRQLPTKVSCQTLKLVDQNFKSFFGLLKTSGSIARMPKYLKTEGRYITKFGKQALKKMAFKRGGKISLSQTNILINTKITNWDSIKEVRIVPRNNFYVIEVVYEKKEKIATGNITASIDPGLNNLATIAFNNNNYQPFIINGRPLKSINQYYNKKKAKIQSQLEKELGKKTSKKLTKLTNKRNQKVNDYMHKSSRKLVNQLVLCQTGTLIIGKSAGQKQDISLGKKNNQNFVQIPLFRFLDMVAYKARLCGIKVIWQEESYTSKASFLSGDHIPTYGGEISVGIHKFSGYRMNRGLYKIKGEKTYINADLNGAYNIMKKAIPNAFANGIEDVEVHPILID